MTFFFRDHSRFQGGIFFFVDLTKQTMLARALASGGLRASSRHLQLAARHARLRCTTVEPTSMAAAAAAGARLRPLAPTQSSEKIRVLWELRHVQDELPETLHQAFSRVNM